uniref:Non-heme iron a-ketoglutarate dependent dioxygenase n=1 Tax=Aspergillus mulundensis TaxID=1810919 RepID=A0A0G3EZI0_9EURO|nr:non-heme iron a-ketoglutarate dependent dioxygenase [Aspergillus mulundensis]
MASISYEGLLRGATKDLQTLTEAALVHGYFNLELDCPEGRQLREDVLFLESFTKEIFDTPAPQKTIYDFKKLGRFRTTGFKPLGIEEGAKGKSDGFEMFMLPHNELLLPSHQASLRSPSAVFTHRAALTRCMGNYEAASQLILRRITESLTLDEALLTAHNPAEPSVTNLGFLRYPPQPTTSENCGHIAHTDVGTLTILAATQRGLQVINSQTEDWTFVDPHPANESLLVQFGDCLKFLSGGRVVPSIHRVIPSDRPEEREGTKYTLAYFVRPNEEAVIRDDGGREWVYGDYHCRKFGAFARPLERDGEGGRDHDSELTYIEQYACELTGR